MSNQNPQWLHHQEGRETRRKRRELEHLLLDVIAGNPDKTWNELCLAMKQAADQQEVERVREYPYKRIRKDLVKGGFVTVHGNNPHFARYRLSEQGAVRHQRSLEVRVAEEIESFRSENLT